MMMDCNGFNSIIEYTKYINWSNNDGFTLLKFELDHED